MKFIILIAVLTFSLNIFATLESTCEATDNCNALTALPSEFNNPEITQAQTDKAFLMADEVLSDIGRSIAGDFEEIE